MVRDADFFLAEDGHSNPASEFHANKLAFWSQDPTQRMLRCRFPARYTWLSHLFDIVDNEGLTACDEYQQWREQMPAGKLVLIFPSYQLNSPSSMFGHTLLRVDPVDTDNHATWLSQAVNFGAVNTDQDGSAAYAFKGISGGYSGSFAVMPYFQKIKEYGHTENRDIWEYELDFSEAETDWMVTHLWELRGIEFGYYFFDQNCSYRLLELLEVARPTLELTQTFELTAIPVDTIRELADQNLIITRKFRPSQERQLHNLLEKIDSNLHDWMPLLRDNPDRAMGDDFQRLPELTRAKLLQAAYGYTRFKDTTGNRQAAANRIKLLRRISSLPSEAREMLQNVSGDSTPSAPEDGHYSRRLQLSYQQTERQNSWLISGRMAFHSLDDNSPGYLAGAQINMLDLQLRIEEDEVELNKLDLIDIASLVPSRRYFPHVAWKVKLGFSPMQLGESDKTVAQLGGGVGYSRALSDRIGLYGLLDIHSEFNHRDGKFAIAAGPIVGILATVDPISLHAEALHHFNGDTPVSSIALNANYRLAKNSSIAFSLQQRKSLELEWQDRSELSFRYFFR